MFELSKAVVNELSDPAVHKPPPGVEQLVTRPVVEQLVRGRHYAFVPSIRAEGIGERRKGVRERWRDEKLHALFRLNVFHAFCC